MLVLKHQSLVTRSHNIQPTGVIGRNHLGGLSVGNCPPNRRLVPGPRFGLSSGGSLDRVGWLRWLRRHLPPDVGRRLVRTSAALSSDHCGKTHLQAPRSKNHLVQNCCCTACEQFSQDSGSLSTLEKIWTHSGRWQKVTAVSATLCTKCLSVSSSVANTGANILSVYAYTKYIAVSAH